MYEGFLPAAPILVVLIGAVISLGFEGLVPRLVRSTLQAAWTALVFLAALGWTVVLWTQGRASLAAGGLLALDGPTVLSWAVLLIFSLMACLLFSERRLSGGDSIFAASASAPPGSLAEREAIAARQEHSEVFVLLSFSVAGMMMFVASTDLLMMFVALEIFSFPLYILAGMARRRRLLSQESSLKYFLLGALSSALFLYGIALTYGYAGGFSFAQIDNAIVNNLESEWLLLAGMSLMVVGVLFKLGAVPFHSWVPDVYTGAPTVVTAFMAVCTKIAAAVGLLRLLYAALGSLRWDWQIAVAVIAVATMIVGAVVGLQQRDVKRLMAYSSIAHAGFILVALVGAFTYESGLMLGGVGSIEAVVLYLLAYGFATMGAFAIISMVRRNGTEVSSYDAWLGIGRRHPWVGIAMTVFVLSMAGIPLTGGFIGKVVAFIAGWQGGYSWLVFIAIIASLITAGFYFRVIYLTFASGRNDDVEVIRPGIGTVSVIWIALIATILMGVYPAPVMELLAAAAGFVR